MRATQTTTQNQETSGMDVVTLCTLKDEDGRKVYHIRDVRTGADLFITYDREKACEHGAWLNGSPTARRQD